MALNIAAAAKKFSAKISLFFGVLIASTKSGMKVQSSGKVVLYSCSDANRGMSVIDGHFSPLLSPIQEHYARLDYDAVNLSYPLSYYDSSAIRGGAIIINRPYIVIWLIEIVERALLGRKIAAKKKSQRRFHLFRGLLTKIRPKLIFATQAAPEFCTAAHDLGIAVIEPMHGMNLSSSDRILQATIRGIDTNALPDAYLAFDDRTRDTLIELIGERGIAVYRMPHPWHVECQNPDSILSGARNSSILNDADKRIKILVSLQWGYAGERKSLSNIIPNGVLHPSVEQAIADNPRVLWLLRLHPVQLRGRGYEPHRQVIQSLSEKYDNVDWEDATVLPLPTILANVQGHITMSSGTCGEAAIFGVPSLLLCPTLKEGGAHGGWFSELVVDGVAEIGELSADHINGWLSRLPGRHDWNKPKNWEEERRKFSSALDEILRAHVKYDSSSTTVPSSATSKHLL